MAALAGVPLLLAVLLLLFVSHSHASDTNALRRLISDLHGQRTPPAATHPCRTPGINCETAVDNTLRATRVVITSRRLDGSLSPAIGRLSDLRELSLPNNRLSGKIPRELAGCRALEILVLRDNRLFGEVPREISTLTALRVLDLSSNRFSGDVLFLRHLPNLENLSLANNYFSGRIPLSLSSLRNLLSIDLSGNPDLVGEVVPAPAMEYSLRRSLLPNRYILAENSTSNSNSNSTKRKRNSTNSSTASAPGPSPTPSTTKHHHVNKRRRLTNGIVGFIAGSLAGVVAGLILSVLFRMLMNFIRGRYKNPGGPSIFSPLIKSPEDLAFLEKEDGLASLEIIGRGGCGEVYKAQLPGESGKMIAIKKVMKRTESADPSEEESKLLDKWMRQIKAEILTVGRIRHRNLLSLLAHVTRNDCHYLVYEYMKNGSLHDMLAQGHQLDWPARHNIAMGIAAGLEYLHHNHKPHIVHRDLKPANILLDDNLEARIADFGLAKELPDANTHMTTSNVAGTVGYIAPEYHQTIKFTTKCDIYSLGVILAVLVIGKLPSDDFFQETEEMSLVKWLRNVMRSANPGAAIDSRLVGQGFEEQMLLVLKIAYFCTLDEPKERPTSKEVRDMLGQIKH